MKSQGPSSWSIYRRRRRTFRLIIASLPAVLGLGYALSRLPDSGIPLLVLAILWMLAFAVSCIHMSGTPCPRCGRPFFLRWGELNPFSSQCQHCGCPKWSEEW
jgi:hypothetical protein